MTVDDDKHTIGELLDGIARRDRAALEQLVTDDVVWWVPRSASRHGLARPLVGRGAVVELLRGSKDFFRPETTTWTVIAMIAEGSAVVAHVRRKVATPGGTVATISAIKSSSIGPGPLGILDTNPSADAPRSIANHASSTLSMQQIFTLVTDPARRWRQSIIEFNSPVK